MGEVLFGGLDESILRGAWRDLDLEQGNNQIHTAMSWAESPRAVEMEKRMRNPVITCHICGEQYPASQKVCIFDGATMIADWNVKQQDGGGHGVHSLMNHRPPWEERESYFIHGPVVRVLDEDEADEEEDKDSKQQEDIQEGDDDEENHHVAALLSNVAPSPQALYVSPTRIERADSRPESLTSWKSPSNAAETTTILVGAEKGTGKGAGSDGKKRTEVIKSNLFLDAESAEGSTPLTSLSPKSPLKKQDGHLLVLLPKGEKPTKGMEWASAAQATERRTYEEAKAIFAALDPRKRGFVFLEEAVLGLKELGFAEEEVDRFVLMTDTNNDGMLSLEEFVNQHQLLAKMTPRRRRQEEGSMGKDGDSVVRRAPNGGADGMHERRGGGGVVETITKTTNGASSNRNSNNNNNNNKIPSPGQEQADVHVSNTVAAPNLRNHPTNDDWTTARSRLSTVQSTATDSQWWTGASGDPPHPRGQDAKTLWISEQVRMRSVAQNVFLQVRSVSGQHLAEQGTKWVQEYRNAERLRETAATELLERIGGRGGNSNNNHSGATRTERGVERTDKENKQSSFAAPPPVLPELAREIARQEMGVLRMEEQRLKDRWRREEMELEAKLKAQINSGSEAGVRSAAPPLLALLPSLPPPPPPPSQPPPPIQRPMMGRTSPSGVGISGASTTTVTVPGPPPRIPKTSPSWATSLLPHRSPVPPPPHFALPDAAHLLDDLDKVSTDLQRRPIQRRATFASAVVPGTTAGMERRGTSLPSIMDTSSSLHPPAATTAAPHPPPPSVPRLRLPPVPLYLFDADADLAERDQRNNHPPAHDPRNPVVQQHSVDEQQHHHHPERRTAVTSCATNTSPVPPSSPSAAAPTETVATATTDDEHFISAPSVSSPSVVFSPLAPPSTIPSTRQEPATLIRTHHRAEPGRGFLSYRESSHRQPHPLPTSFASERANSHSSTSPRARRKAKRIVIENDVSYEEEREEDEETRARRLAAVALRQAISFHRHLQRNASATAATRTSSSSSSALHLRQKAARGAVYAAKRKRREDGSAVDASPSSSHQELSPTPPALPRAERRDDTAFLPPLPPPPPPASKLSSRIPHPRPMAPPPHRSQQWQSPRS